MLTLATIGTSQITKNLADAVSRVPGVRIGCVYSRDEGRAAEFAAQLGVGSSASDLDAVLGDPGIDAIYVASPNSVHAAQAAQALRAGKHVLVEKPAVTDLADWDALVSLAAQNGVVVLEAIRTRFDPGLAAVAELLPTVGVLRKVSLRYEKRSSRYDQVLAGEVPNIFDPRFGGGALNDLGIYVIHALLSLLGPPDHVVAMNVPIRTGVDGLGTILASYPGFVADLHYSKITSPEQPSVIQGEDGVITIDAIDAPRSITCDDGAEQRTTTVDAPPNPMEGEVRRFADLVAGTDDPGADNAATRQALQIIAAAAG